MARLPYRAGSVLGKPTLEPVASGVWVMRDGLSTVGAASALVRGRRPQRVMNVYLLQDDGGVTMFDAGIAQMAPYLADVTQRMGGLRRIVLGHADPDHRGAAAGLDAPVVCHPDEVEKAQAAGDPAYVDYGLIEDPLARRAMPRLLRHWDGGPVTVAGTVSEGDEVAGFEVRHFPGHAPGLIGLWRESDRLALVSDVIYTFDTYTGVFGAARVPNRFYTQDSGRARASIRELAALGPRTVWAGHADPVSGDVVDQLEAAASGPQA